MEHALNGRKALVTGGASGIGAACVRELAARGAKVVVADVDAAGAAALADEVGGTSWAVDLLDVDALATLSLDCDILVNNAGIQRVSPIEEFDPVEFRRILALMLEAPFLLIRAALPHMYANGFGRIINLSSVHGLRASAVQERVRLRQARPGRAEQGDGAGGRRARRHVQLHQPRLRPHAAGGKADRGPGPAVHGIPESEVLAKVMLTESAVKRLVEPEEVASLVAWLASDHAGMVTGASYTMDGGWSAQ